MPTPDDFSDFFYPAQDGLRLHARIYGADNNSGWPIVCLPGLTRNARDFHELALYLAQHAKSARKIVAFDYRGRGQSAYDPKVENYNVGIETVDIITGLAALGIAEAAFIGTSRGGLIIHVLGSLKPDLLKAIIFNDIGPVIEVEGLAHIRSYLERAPKPQNLYEAVLAQKAAHGAEFPALNDADWTRMAGAIYSVKDGCMEPDFDPKLVDTLADLDLSKPLPTLWPQFDALAGIPILAIRGAHSQLLSDATLTEMEKRHDGLEPIIVEGQGHAPFLETGNLPALISNFIDRAENHAK